MFAKGHTIQGVKKSKSNQNPDKNTKSALRDVIVNLIKNVLHFAIDDKKVN